MAAEATVRVAEPRDAMEVVVEQETAEPRDSRKGNAKTRRQPRPPVMGAGKDTLTCPTTKTTNFLNKLTTAHAAGSWRMYFGN